MNYGYEQNGGKLTVFIPKELDHHEVDMLIDTYRVRSLILDFSNTEFMDSSGIGVVIGRCRNMSFSGGEVCARNLNERVDKIFTVSGLKKIIKIEK